jgi:phosphatidyl-myo-inositol alpha-mannosyltransferase
MRIAMVSPYALNRHGGAQGQAVGLARALRRLGHDVVLVGPADPDPALDALGDHFVVGHPTGVSTNGSVAPVALSPAAPVRAERFIRAGGFDVVHVHEPLAPLTAYGLVLRPPPAPMVGTYHRAGVSRAVAPLHPLAALVGRRMRIRVAVSEAARQTGLRAGGGPFEVLFNGIDMARFESASPVRDPQGRPVVVFVGRHEHRKGLAVLLDAFTMVERPAVLWVIGQGPDTEALRRRSPPTDRVEWLGALSDEEMAARLAGADVQCAPALGGESFGLVLLEGMAAGCVVVASDIDGYRQAAGGQAELVPPGDAHALARVLRQVLADAATGTGRSAPEARQAAREHARAWSMDTLAQRYVELYLRAIAEA